MEKLKNCPFCGGKAKLQETEGGDFLVYCSKCNVTMHDCMLWEDEGYDAMNNVIAKWNKRVKL